MTRLPAASEVALLGASIPTNPHGAPEYHPTRKTTPAAVGCWFNGSDLPSGAVKVREGQSATLPQAPLVLETSEPAEPAGPLPLPGDRAICPGGARCAAVFGAAVILVETGR